MGTTFLISIHNPDQSGFDSLLTRINRGLTYLTRIKAGGNIDFGRCNLLPLK
jgi:hypothetical protein